LACRAALALRARHKRQVVPLVTVVLCSPNDITPDIPGDAGHGDADEGPTIVHDSTTLLAFPKSIASVHQLKIRMSVSEHGTPKVRTSRLKQLVYTYLVGRIAGNDGVFDSKGPTFFIVDGSSQLRRVRRQGHCFWSVTGGQ
jgi:hypothetical protein